MEPPNFTKNYPVYFENTYDVYLLEKLWYFKIGREGNNQHLESSEPTIAFINGILEII